MTPAAADPDQATLHPPQAAGRSTAATMSAPTMHPAPPPLSRFLFAALAATLLPGVAHAGPKDVLYVYGTHPPAIAGETLRLSETGNLGYSGFASTLTSAGFTLTEFEAGPGSTGRLDAATLSPYGVLILSSNNRVFTAAEALAVRDWVQGGGGIVAFSDAAFGRDADGNGSNDANTATAGVNNTFGADSDNALTEQFGLTFLRDNTTKYQIMDYEAEHYINNFTLAGDDPGGITFRGEGVSPIAVSDGAVILATLQNPDNSRDGGYSGNATINSNDPGSFDPDVHAALAYNSFGDGRIVGTFDRNTFWNNGPGTDLDQVDNEDYALRLVEWASGVGPVPEPASAAVLLLGGVLLAAPRRRRR